jgi:hypothetical protein
LFVVVVPFGIPLQAARNGTIAKLRKERRKRRMNSPQQTSNLQASTHRSARLNHIRGTYPKMACPKGQVALPLFEVQQFQGLRAVLNPLLSTNEHVEPMIRHHKPSDKILNEQK